MSDLESNSDSTGVGALGCLCALDGLLIRSGEDCIEEDVEEEDIGVDEREVGCSMNGSDSIKLKSSE
jgi:hypothetical protein